MVKKIILSFFVFIVFLPICGSFAGEVSEGWAQFAPAGLPREIVDELLPSLDEQLTSISSKVVSPEFQEAYNYSWGEVTENGLQLGIALLRIYSGDDFIVYLCLRNTSEVIVETPFRKDIPWMAIAFTIIASDEASIGMPLEAVNMTNFYDAHRVKKFIFLKPGEAIEGSLNIMQGPKGLHAIQNLKPGEYKIKASFDYGMAVTIESEKKVGFETIIKEKPAFPQFSNIKGDSGTVSFTIKSSPDVTGEEKQGYFSSHAY